MEKYLDMKSKIDYEKLKEVAITIKNGGIVIFPTETVYGIGTNGLSSNAIEKVFKVKGRSTKNPINLLVSSKEMVESIAKDITELEYKLMDAFFPGALTIILNKKENLPNIVTAGGDTVGVRMPSGKIAKKLVEEAGVPIAAPSANVSGKPSGTNINDIIEEFKDKVDYIIDEGASKIGIESTIVKVIDGVPHILRPGAITEEQIQQIAGKVALDYLKNENNELLPSSELSHYKTNAKCIVVKNGKEQVEEVKKILTQFENSIVICCNENACKYKAKEILTMGAKENLEEISQNIFRLLRKADELNPNVIIIEGVDNKRYW